MELFTRNRILELPQNAIQEIRKVHDFDKEEILNEALDILEEWMKKQDHFLKKDFSRFYLEKKIIVCKGSMEKTKQQLDKLCTMKTLLPHFFTKINLKTEFDNIFDSIVLAVLPKTTTDVYRIWLVRLNGSKISEKIVLDYFQYTIMACEYLMRHDYNNGFIAVVDLHDFNIIDLISALNPVLLQQLLSLLIEGYGARIKGIYILSKSKVIDLLTKLIMPIVSQKIFSRLRVFKTLEELHTVVPKDILPVEYGGDERPFMDLVVDLYNELSTEEHMELLKMMYKAGTNENLRKSSNFNEEYMGTPGSFRHITLD